jgi:hypothetical protein
MFYSMKAYLRCIRVIVTIGMMPLLLASQPANAESKTRFVCGSDQDRPATLAILPDGGQAPIIRYSSGAFEPSGFSDQKRCEEISARFQYFYDLRENNFMTTGRINGQNVICVTRREGGDCSRDLKSEGLLITVRPGVNPNVTLQELVNVRVQAGSALEENGSRPYVNTHCLIDAGNSQKAYHSCVERRSRLSNPFGSNFNEVTNSTSCIKPSKDVNSSSCSTPPTPNKDINPAPSSPKKPRLW